jgi:hypothetical protein
MSPVLQGVIVGVLVLAAAAYTVWRMGPASLRRRFGRADAADKGDGCSNCSSFESRKK